MQMPHEGNAPAYPRCFVSKQGRQVVIGIDVFLSFGGSSTGGCGTVGFGSDRFDQGNVQIHGILIEDSGSYIFSVHFLCGWVMCLVFVQDNSIDRIRRILSVVVVVVVAAAADRHQHTTTARRCGRLCLLRHVRCIVRSLLLVFVGIIIFIR